MKPNFFDNFEYYHHDDHHHGYQSISIQGKPISQIKPVMIGVGGPVGTGKTTLIEKLCKTMSDDYEIAVITNDIYTKEDAQILTRLSALDPDRIVGVETGGCPHHAIRDDVSANLEAVEDLLNTFTNLDILFIESGGDNLAASFSPELVDREIYVIDVSAGDKLPRKGGPGIMKSDLLIINKIDIARYVGSDLDIMKRDSEKMRQGKQFVLCDLISRKGMDDIVAWVQDQVAQKRANN